MRLRTLVLALALWAAPATAEPTYPALSGRVVDAAELLSPGAEQRLTAQLARHEAETSNQVVVATLPSLQGLEIEEYGIGLARAWGIGQAGRDNGAVLIVAPNERQTRIEVGYGLEGTLTDAVASDIVRNRLLPAFRAGRYEAGIQEGVNAILAAIADTYQPLAKESGQPLLPFLLIAAFIVIVLVVKARNAGLFGPVDFGSGGWGGGSGTSYRRGGWSSGSGHSSGGGRSSGGFSGGGGRFGGGGASGRW